LKVLILNWRCWLNPDAGGAEVFTREVAKGLAKRGHVVTLFTSKFHGCKSEEDIDDVRIVRAGNKYSVYWKAKEYYRKCFFKEGYDIIIDEINTRPFLTPKFVCNGERIFALIHQLAREYWFYETPFPVNYIGFYHLENRWLKNYVYLPTVTVSQSTMLDLVSLGFRKVFIVPEGLNFKPLDRVPEKESFPTVVYAGRLKRAKRPDLAVKAFKTVKKNFPTSELWILGDGPFKKNLERMAISGVRFFGNLPNEIRRKLVERAWVLVNPSVREGWGLNVVEANALGVPCIAYDVAGLRDAIKDGETGLITHAEGPEKLAENIKMIFSDNELRLMLSQNALSYSRMFSWDGTVDAFLKVMQGV